MRKLTVFATLLSTMAPLTAARNCTPGLVYCGKTLRKIAAERQNYDRQIREAMAIWGYKDPTNEDMDNSLFYCGVIYDGYISMVTLCTTYCVDLGLGADDLCALPEPESPAGNSADVPNQRDGRPGQGFGKGIF
ncbi:hypothetical protein V8F06_009902 [Rhypophila decipiens]